MKIIDAQIHIWLDGTPSGLHRKVRSYTAEDALAGMDEAGVDGALIHPPVSWDAGANEYAVASAAQHPDRFAVMGQFPPRDPAKLTADGTTLVSLFRVDDQYLQSKYTRKDDAIRFEITSFTGKDSLKTAPTGSKVEVEAFELTAVQTAELKREKK